jgi:HEAT repeat protein
MEKAQAGGRNDGRLKDNIERVEKQLAEGKVVTEEELKQAELEQQKERARYEKFEQANAAVRSKNAAQRIGGIRNLCAMAGADCVSVAAFLMQNDNEYAVREAAAVALGSLGAAAKPALPNLKAMLNHACDDSLTMTNEQMAASLKCQDFKKAVRDAYQKVSK